MNEILVTGAAGQLGQALSRHAWPAGWLPVARSRAELDLTSLPAIAGAVAERPWAAVINAGAYTAVDRAEGEPLAAWQVNALAPAALAAACRAADVPLVQVSTDYVFPGDKAGAWEVDDPARPLGIYGASKLAGEWAVRTGCPRHAIVRTAWVVSATGHNFVRTMLRLAAERPTLRVVADQRGAPTAAADLAAALATIAVGLAAGHPSGVWHFTNTGATDWAAIAEAIFAGSAARDGPTASVEPIATADYPTAARRPANSLLSLDAIARDWNIRPRSWQDALEPILDALIGSRKDPHP